MICFLFFPENRTWHFMQIVICMKWQSLFFEINKKKIFQNVVCWKFYPECLSIKVAQDFIRGLYATWVDIINCNEKKNHFYTKGLLSREFPIISLCIETDRPDQIVWSQKLIQHLRSSFSIWLGSTPFATRPAVVFLKHQQVTKWTFKF